MNIHLQTPTRLTVTDFEDDAFNISEDNSALYLSALSMWIAALARCTFAVLEHYGHRFDSDPSTVEISMDWDFLDNPTRFKTINMDIYWPTLDDKRIKPVQRAAQKCTIHNTIHDCVEINTSVRNI